MKLVPNPQVLQENSGNFRLNYRHRITMDASCPTAVYDTACLLQQEVLKRTGFSLAVDRRSIPAHPGIVLALSEPVGPESYTLTISESGISVTGGDERGLLYGVQTLRQILRQQGCLLPCLQIRDYPQLKARGLFYDVTRGRIPTMDYLKGLADKCSFYKLNQLHLYIEHSFLFDGFSEVWRDDTPLTAADILELDAHCRKRHVELVPSVATLGHLYKVLRGRQYGHLSELEEGDAEFSFHARMHHHTLDTTQAQSLELVYRMIDEYASLFTSKLFNINGDEVFDLGRGRGKQRAEEVGSHRMYLDWVAKICAHVKEKGLRPMFWGDVILTEPETIRELPADIICMNWDYEPDWREDHAASLAKTGVTQYLCPGLQGWNNTINLFEVAYRNLHKMATLAHKYGGEGLLVTEWGDYGHLQDPEFARPGIAWAGAMGWNREILPMEQLNAAVSRVEYGDRSESILEVVTRLSDQFIMNWGQIVEYVEICRNRLEGGKWDRFRRHHEEWIRMRLARAEEIQTAIDVCQEEIAALMPEMEQPERLLPYFLMSDGQKLLNRYALWLSGREEDTKALAAELEGWYREYRNLWYKTSRESELYRIGEVIFWMADSLR